MGDREDLYTVLGQAFFEAASLDYAAATLAAILDGKRDQDCEDCALRTVKKGHGAARQELDRVVGEHPEHAGLGLVADEVRSLIKVRNVIAHSVALDDVEINGRAAVVMYDPQAGRETEVTTAGLREHAQAVRVTWQRINEIIAAECAAG